MSALMGMDHPSVSMSLTGRAGLFGERKKKSNKGSTREGFGPEWDLDPVTGQKMTVKPKKDKSYNR